MPIAKSTLIYQGQALHASDWLQRVAEYVLAALHVVDGGEAKGEMPK